MSENLKLSQEELDLAGQQEEFERLKGQIQHLSQRNTVLRALVNKLQADAKTEVENESVSEPQE